MIQGKESLSLDLASFPLILLYSSMESCFIFFELFGFADILTLVYHLLKIAAI